VPEASAEGVLEACSAYFEAFLRESDIGRQVRARLSRLGIEAEALRAFRVGYAPGDTRLLLEYMRDAGYSDDDLISAGVASTSESSYLHVRFHARIMFPIRDATGSLRGFAGLATHLGPSWPLWLTSPDNASFNPSAAMFAIDQASASITRARRALVLRDCIQVLALHQRGRREAVAVIHSPITRTHLARFAELVGADSVHLARRDGHLGVAVLPAGEEVAEDAFADRATPSGFMLINSDRRLDRASHADDEVQAKVDDRVESPTRPVVYLAGGLIGIGLPIGLLLLASAHNGSTHDSTPALNIVILGVATVYLLLTLGVARISARVRARSRTRRMREPWARGSDEVQPRGWTYHRLEEILVGAALVSALTCVALLMTIGGFFG